MIVANPLYGLLVGVVVLLETRFSMILRKSNIPKPDPFYKFVRILLVISLASYIVNTIIYKPLHNGEILSLILISVSAYIGLLSILILKNNLTSISVLVGFITSFISSLFIGIAGIPAGLIAWMLSLIVQLFKKYEIEVLDRTVNFQWDIIIRYHLIEIFAITESIILVARIQGYVFF